MPYTNVPNEYSGTEQGVSLTSWSGGTSSVEKSIDLSAQQDTNPLNPVGCITRYQGKLYRYVYFSSGTSVAGAPAYFLTTTDPANGLFSVTSATATAAANLFAGVFLASGLTTGKYVWIQVAGINEALVCTSGAAVGERLYANADATFTQVSGAVSGVELSVGEVTVAEDGSNVAGALILGPFCS